MNAELGGVKGAVAQKKHQTPQVQESGAMFWSGSEQQLTDGCGRLESEVCPPTVSLCRTQVVTVVRLNIGFVVNVTVTPRVRLSSLLEHTKDVSQRTRSPEFYKLRRGNVGNGARPGSPRVVSVLFPVLNQRQNKAFVPRCQMMWERIFPFLL